MPLAGILKMVNTRVVTSLKPVLIEEDGQKNHQIFRILRHLGRHMETPGHFFRPGKNVVLLVALSSAKILVCSDFFRRFGHVYWTHL